MSERGEGASRAGQFAARGAPGPPLPDRVTMPLLALVSEQALDDDYAAAARRRGGEPPSRGGHRAVAVAVAVFGLLIAVAAVQTSRTATVQDAGRAGLLARIEQQREVVARQQQQVAELRVDNSATAATLSDLTQTEAATTNRTRRLQASTGFAAVGGPGVRVRLDQASGARAEQLRDSDLALLVNGLWGAGAEAISVNGQRLTSLTAIRTSGQAVEVNGVGVAPPYTVLAIGDPATLQSRFYDTGSGLSFDTLARDYGFTFDMDNVDDLSLPAAPPRLQRLRSATPDTTAGPNEDQPDQDPEQEVQP